MPPGICNAEGRKREKNGGRSASTDVTKDSS